MNTAEEAVHRLRHGILRRYGRSMPRRGSHAQEAPVQACELLDRKSLASVGDTTGEGLTALPHPDRSRQQGYPRPPDCRHRSHPEPFPPLQRGTFLHRPRHGGRLVADALGSIPHSGRHTPLGTTAIIEDVAFHIENLPEATVALAKLIDDCGYDDACIYGHALEGNYHFITAQGLRGRRPTSTSTAT